MNLKLTKLLFVATLCFSTELVAQDNPVSHPAPIPASGAPSSPNVQGTTTQQPETGLDMKWFNKTRTVQASDNWSVSGISTALNPGVQATVTLSVGPTGVDTGGIARFGGPWG